jgi:molecular chaperone IbpA
MNVSNIALHPSAFFKDFDKFFVGFDDTYNRLSKLHDDLTQSVPNYPPYNIKKIEENKYVIEIAAAGFAKQDIEITLEDNKLIVRGTSHDDHDNFIFKGIANRAFTRTFALDDQIVIKDAAMLNGMLKIALEKIIPDHRKPRKIEISDEPSTVSQYAKGNPQFLAESPNAFSE